MAVTTKTSAAKVKPVTNELAELRADVRDSDGALLLLLDVLEDGSDEPPVPPTEFMLLGAGVTPTTKGPIVCSGAAALAVVNKMRADGRDSLPFDYGHAMLGFLQSYDSAKAAGWFVPEVRGDELWATKIKWTPTAMKAFADREFRYFSPALLLDIETRVVAELINCALTNIPATLNQEPLVADNRGGSMDPILQKLLLAMGVQNADQATAKYDGLRNENEKLVKAAGELQVELSAANTALKTIKDETAKAEKEAFIVQLSKDGKLSPALKSWASDQTLESLKVFSANAPVMSGTKVESKDAPNSPNSLSDEQKSVALQLGISEKDFLAGLVVQASQSHPMIFTPAEVSK